jgi:hypothetical protein
MTADTERRGKHRRFSDRRVHLLLALHEILFEMDDGDERNTALIDEVRLDFESDRAALVTTGGGADHGVRVTSVAGEWDGDLKGRRLYGKGLADLLDVHGLAGGAVTLTYTRRPSAFSPEGWDKLWAGDLGAQTRALLSVAVRPVQAERSLLWLQQASNSREWSSQDRELAEEVASLLARAADKASGGG